MPTVITIDGPAGAGKSSLARRLAAELGFGFLDTGAMYRAVALAMLEAGLDPCDENLCSAQLPQINLRLDPPAVFLGGRDVSSLLRTPAVTAASSKVAALGSVRRWLVPQQRRFAEGRDVVTEGRDQGTAVFPSADVKFFLTADPRTRAERRRLDLIAAGQPADFDAILADIVERDRRDSSRAVDPLRAAADANAIDTSDLTPDEVLARMLAEVAAWRAS